MAKFYIKTNRVFTKWREWAWIMTFVISVGGLFEPRLGLLVPGVILGLLVTSFFKGRFWCGNVCFHGSFYDRILIKVSKNIEIPRVFKSKFFLLAGVAFFAYRIGSRLFFIFTSQLDTLTTLGRVGAVFVSVYWMVMFISVPLGILFSSRTWCQFCPMGTFQRLSYKLGKILRANKKTDTKISIQSKALCHSCGKCSRVCPMQLNPYLDFDGNNQLNSDKCIKCQTCVHNCPAEILSLKNEQKAIESTRLAEQTFLPIKPEYAATIQDLTLLDENILEIVFALENPSFKFIPGQFILVRIQAMIEDHSHIKFSPVVAFDENYQGEKGFVTNVIERLALQDTKIYMCGPKPMVVSVERLLNKRNFNKDNLFMESA